MKDVVGTVYLIHFDEKLAHAQHYIGFTTNLEQRIATHKSGFGSALMAAVTQNGIGWKVVRTWENVTRAFERKMHKMNNTARYCPVCATNLDEF